MSLPAIKTTDATLPAVYESARTALATCEQIDECKEWSDKAQALRSYALQAEDQSLLNHAMRIQSRAARRMGELLDQIEPKQGANQNIGMGDHTKVLTRTSAAEAAGLSKHQQVQAVRVARVPAEEFERQVESENPPTITALAEQGKRTAHVSHNSGENEWYTPPEYIAACKEVLREIDLDPASSDKAQETVGALSYYTIESDGLTQDWKGRVWMNPPYSSDLVGRFCEKLTQEILKGAVTEAIVLVNNATETRWFQGCAQIAAAACFPQGRIRYLASDGMPRYTPLQGQCFLYFGDYPKRFKEVFGRFGLVVTVG